MVKTAKSVKPAPKPDQAAKAGKAAKAVKSASSSVKTPASSRAAAPRASATTATNKAADAVHVPQARPRAERGVALKPREAAPVLVKIDQNQSVSSRPMVGLDLQRFQAQHNLQMVDVIYALGIQNSAVYGRLARGDQLPFAIELLIRLYDRYPGPAPWGALTPTDGFEMLYGPILREFETFQGGFYRDLAYKALCTRMTAAFGRSVFTSYRWFSDRGEGNAKVQIVRILNKLSAMSNPREELEDIVRLMYKVRGVSFDNMAPLPTKEKPPQAKRRGPVPGSRRKKAESGGVDADAGKMNLSARVRAQGRQELIAARTE